MYGMKQKNKMNTHKPTDKLKNYTSLALLNLFPCPISHHPVSSQE